MISTALATKPVNTFKGCLVSIRSALDAVDNRVKNWNSLSGNAQANIITRLKLAASFLLGREGVPLTAFKGDSDPKSLHIFQKVNEDLKALQNGDLETAPPKTQPHYLQVQVEKVLKAMRSALDWAEQAPLEGTREATPKQLTQVPLNGYSIRSGTRWTMPFFNNVYFERGWGSWTEIVFDSEDNQRNNILRLENRDMTISEENGKVHIVPSKYLKEFLNPILIGMPIEVIGVINQYWLKSHTLWIGAPKLNAHCDISYSLYSRPPNSRPPISIEGTHLYREPLLGVKRKINQWELTGRNPKTSGHWICLEDSYQGPKRTLAHVSLMQPVRKEMLLVGYPGSDEITCYRALVDHYANTTSVRALSFEHLPLITYSQINVTLYRSLVNEYQKIGDSQ